MKKKKILNILFENDILYDINFGIKKKDKISYSKKMIVSGGNPNNSNLNII